MVRSLAISRWMRVVRVNITSGLKSKALDLIEIFSLPDGCLNHMVVDTGRYASLYDVLAASVMAFG